MAPRPEHLPDDVAIYEQDGILYGLDDDGEFEIDPPRGNAEPQNGLCNATLTRSQERYGETRFCGRTPYWPSDDSDEEPSGFCRNHKGREQLMERAIELVEHGYFGRNYVVFEQSLDASEFIHAVNMFAGLLEQSRYDFEVEKERRAIDASSDDLVGVDSIEVTLPLPQTKVYGSQAQELWHFALDEVVEQRMQHLRLVKGVDGEHIVATADEDGVITDTKTEASESHLNLPISRLSKDKKERLKIGGVEVGAEEGDQTFTFTTGDYVMDIGDEAPEETEPMEEPMTAQLEPPEDDE